MATQELIRAREKLKEVRISQMVKNQCNYRYYPLNKLSVDMGYKENYLYRALKNNDLTGINLMQISHYLGINMFEFYINKMREDIRPTKAEKELKKENEALKKQVEDLTKERDWLKEVVMKR